MKAELVFTQLVNGDFINHCNIEIPKYNLKVKHRGFIKLGLPYNQYLKFQKELEERVNQFKKEKLEKLIPKVNLSETYLFALNKIEQVQLT